MVKGIITAAGEYIKHEGSDGVGLHASLRKVDMNYYALYWDKVIFPRNGMVGFGVPYEEDLISCGIVEKPYIHREGAVSYSNLTSNLIEDLIFTANKFREERKDFDWFIHQMTGSGVASPDNVRKMSLRLDLMNLLPVPNENVHIADVLEFKERRSDELKNMHTLIDNLYLKVLQSGDFELSRSAALSELKEAFQSLDKVSSESWGVTSKFNLSLSIEPDLFAMVKDIALGGLAFQSITVALAAGALGAIKISPKQEYIFEKEVKKKGVTYLSNANLEGLL